MVVELEQLGVYYEGRLVGTVALDESGRFTFEYAPAWQADPKAFAISRSLPLAGGDAPASAGHAFFANLLPEGRVRELVARHLGVSQGNDFALLDALGGECAGALVISRARPPAKSHSYRPLDEPEIAALASRGRAFAETSGTAGIRLSLAGAQDKLAVKVDGAHLLLPEGDSPSTHILKFANPDYKYLPENELFVTRLAGRCDIPTVSTELRAIGKVRHLLVKRYDRVVDETGTIRRLHQEDLCQALGVPPARKYQEEGGPRFDQCFGVVDEASVEPALDTRALLRWLVFNLIVGNADGHAKNLSLVFGPRGALRLAPFYDLLSTAVYPRIASRLAMSVNAKSDPGQIAGKDWGALAKAIGVGSFLEDAVGELVEELPQKARQLAHDLESEYGRITVTEAILTAVRKRARRTKQLLGT
jgi:serine/threonine-protein kinase HipA